jgi:flagellar motor switch protein FliN/FliY
MGSDADQEALAAAWAAELEAEEGDGAGAAAPQETPSSAKDMAAKWAEALAAEEKTETQAAHEKTPFKAQAAEAVFKDMTDAAHQPRHDSPKRELDFILDIPLVVSAELGRTRLLINELLQLGQGSVVELNKLAGEPLEVYVNDKLVARGEAVVINEKFGVRLTDIISPMERVKQLG